MTLHHRGTVPLETDRLRLRRFTADDAEAMFHNWASDPEVARYLAWPAHPSVETSVAVLDEWVDNYAKTDHYNWAIELKDYGQPIGSIGAVRVDDALQALEVGYCIGREWWGRGIVTEALDRLLEFFFDEVGAVRISALHLVGNPASGRVMQKSGMSYEGCQRQRARNNQGKLVDAKIYAIVASDPRNLRDLPE